MDGLGLIVGSAGLYVAVCAADQYFPGFMVVWGNVALILSQARMWTNLRVFGGKTARWAVIVAFG